MRKDFLNDRFFPFEPHWNSKDIQESLKGYIGFYLKSWNPSIKTGSLSFLDLNGYY